MAEWVWRGKTRETLRFRRFTETPLDHIIGIISIVMLLNGFKLLDKKLQRLSIEKEGSLTSASRNIKSSASLHSEQMYTSENDH